jgi:hypothetical protein
LKPLLVGESNPYGADPEMALLPAVGGLLRSPVMGISRDEYLRRFDRANLCEGRWSMPAARREVRRLIDERSGVPAPANVLVLLGRRVVEAAFGRGYMPEPFTRWQSEGGPTLVVLPHPSGLCRLWSEPGAFERARAALRAAGVLA